MAANQAEDWKGVYPGSLRSLRADRGVRSMNRAEGLASRKVENQEGKACEGEGEQRLPPRRAAAGGRPKGRPSPRPQGGIEHGRRWFSGPGGQPPPRRETAQPAGT